MNATRARLWLAASVGAIGITASLVAAGHGVGITYAAFSDYDVSGPNRVGAARWGATPPECAHISFANVIIGTGNDDVLHGTQHNDLIIGLSGNDVLYGYQGQDCLVGGPGDDTLFGGQGKDVLYGDEEDDVLIGTNGPDTIDGGDGDDDTCDGGRGPDRITRCER